MAERAVDMAKAAPIDPYCGLADKSQLARSWNIKSLNFLMIGRTSTRRIGKYSKRD